MAPVTPRGDFDDPTRTDSWWREQLSKLYGLFIVSMMMFDSRRTDDIVHLATTSVPSLCGCEVDGVYLMTENGLARRDNAAPPPPELDEHVARLDGHSGRIDMPDGTWRWACALRGLGGLSGWLVVRAAIGPSRDDFFLLTALGQQTAGALANASLHRRQQRQADELLELNGQLSGLVGKLKQQTHVHEMLTGIAASGAGETGIANVLHTLTELPVAIEDKFGNLRAWSGPGEPHPYPKVGVDRRAELLREAAAKPHPLRHKDRLISLVKPRHEVLGLLALVDPDGAAGQHEMFALEYGTTVLALELAHQRNLAQVELRMHRELVDDLIAGTDEDSAYARADAIGHDLRDPHHVVVTRWQDQSEETVAEAAARALSAQQLSGLISRRSRAVVILVHGRPDGDALHQAMAETLGGTGGSMGVGGRCAGPADFPRSYSEASRALAIQHGSRVPHGVTSFDKLGVYRILDTGESRGEIIAFVREWIGPLLDYDENKNADLVHTLAQYLECGGRYDETAAALTIHRSTLRYRLGRIRTITNLDISDVDSKLNLHVATRAWQVLRGPG